MHTLEGVGVPRCKDRVIARARRYRRYVRIPCLIGFSLLCVLALLGCGRTIEGAPGTVPAGDVDAGQVSYATTCASCHGPAASGTEKGPPLVDSIYRPSHHADVSFLLAVRRGVPEHHWNFGDMPSQPAVSDDQLADIVAYVRVLQRRAGID